MATNYSTGGCIGPNFDTTHTEAKFKLGHRELGKDNQVWVYVQASGAIRQYDAVGIDENYQAGALTKAMADDNWTPGVAQVAFADNAYGWVAVQGQNLSVAVLASCAADVGLFTSAVAGVLDDDTSSQTKLIGAVLVEAATSGTSTREVSLVNPHFYIGPPAV